MFLKAERNPERTLLDQRYSYFDREGPTQGRVLDLTIMAIPCKFFSSCPTILALLATLHLSIVEDSCVGPAAGIDPLRSLSLCRVAVKDECEVSSLHMGWRASQCCQHLQEGTSHLKYEIHDAIKGSFPSRMREEGEIAFCLDSFLSKMCPISVRDGKREIQSCVSVSKPSLTEKHRDESGNVLSASSRDMETCLALREEVKMIPLHRREDEEMVYDQNTVQGTGENQHMAPSRARIARPKGCHILRGGDGSIGLVKQEVITEKEEE